MEAILEAKRLCREYEVGGERVAVLKDIGLNIGKGEFVAVMGRSGSGKSTLLYCISGMDRMSSGEVYFNGKDISCLNDRQMSRLRLTAMGFVFQHSHLLKNLSIKENIILPALKAALKPRAEILGYADALMKRLGIDRVGSHDITKVSGGQLQRAAICRALINHPVIIFCDEPTGALNSSATSEVMNIFNDINWEGTAILLVTHDVRVAARADRVIFLADGRIDSELVLGKYSEDVCETGGDTGGIDEREGKLINWLAERGF